MRILFANLNNNLSKSEDFFNRFKVAQAVTNLACMANVAVQERHSVKIVDGDSEDLDTNALMDVIKEYRPHAIVIHIEDAHVRNNLEQVAIIKATYDGCKMLVHNNYLYNVDIESLNGMNIGFVDAIIGEEPNDLLPKILDGLFDNYPLKKVSNVRYRNENKRWKMTDSVFFQHVDAISTPYRKGLKHELYKTIDGSNPMAIIKVSRGSQSDCIYENIQALEGKVVRTRSPENIAKEIVNCYNDFGITHYFLETEDFNHDDQWAYNVSYAIRNSDVGGKVSLYTKIHLKDLNRELVEEMNFAGFKMVIINICSASEETLRRSKTSTSSKTYQFGLDLLHRFGIKTYAIYRIGFPWEMKRHIEETAKMMYKHVHTYVDFQIVNPTYMSMSMIVFEDEQLLGSPVDDISYSTLGTKYLNRKELEKLYSSICKKYKLLQLFKKEQINEEIYKLTESDKKLKNKKTIS